MLRRDDAKNVPAEWVGGIEHVRSFRKIVLVGEEQEEARFGV